MCWDEANELQVAKLQWGRDREVAEMRRRVEVWSAASPASMGPRP